MKVLVTGSRHWSNRVVIGRAISDTPATILVHGGARGADTIAGEIARTLGIEERVYPADWAAFGKSAGKNRNLRMLHCEHLEKEPIDLVLAFPLPDSIGTYHMIGLAVKAKIPIIIGGVLIEPIDVKEIDAAETV